MESEVETTQWSAHSMPDNDFAASWQEQLKSAIKNKYRGVSRKAEGRFPYPVGQESLKRLGYLREWIRAVPKDVVDRFVGVGNPFSIRPVGKGERVLDIGCGCGLDSFVAALQTGPEGLVFGIDLTAEMLDWARKAQAETAMENLCFQEGSAEELPFENASFDLVISNGVLNLVPDKESAFREIARVLRPEGSFVAADLVVVESIPEETLASMDAWST
jgi:arsenite methyltransferase